MILLCFTHASLEGHNPFTQLSCFGCSVFIVPSCEQVYLQCSLLQSTSVLKCIFLCVCFLSGRLSALFSNWFIFTVLILYKKSYYSCRHKHFLCFIWLLVQVAYKLVAVVGPRSCFKLRVCGTSVFNLIFLVTCIQHSLFIFTHGSLYQNHISSLHHDHLP